MYGAEERYDPSRSNDRVLSQLQRFRDQELENLRQSGAREAMATRESMQNIAKIPENIVDSYVQGTEENRKQRQQDMLEGQEARQKELHPLDIESRKSTLERNKFGLAEEQKTAGDTERQRNWKTTKRAKGLPGEGMTNEEYSYKLGEDSQVVGIQGQKAQQGLAGAQTQNVVQNTQTTKQDNAIKLATGQYLAAIQSGDQQAVADLDKKFSATMDPGAIQMAKLNAQSTIKSATQVENLAWNDSPQGRKTMVDLATIQKKAATLSLIKTAIAQFDAASFESTKQNESKANIIALLNREEMGPEGKHAAELVQSGVLGVKLDLAGFSGPGERLANSVQGLERSIESDLKQIQTQNQGVKASGYLTYLQNTIASFQQAKNTSVRPADLNIFGNPTATNPVPGGAFSQQINSQPPAPVGSDRFMKIQDRSGK